MRSEVLPNVPTVAEFVPGFENSAWNGVGAPRNTPADIITKLNNEINAALASPVMKARWASPCFPARPPTSASSLPTKQRNGPR
jgi:tripartite-type tricarboxylate transporter receptor subunit TctC